MTGPGVPEREGLERFQMILRYHEDFGYDHSELANQAVYDLICMVQRQNSRVAELQAQVEQAQKHIEGLESALAADEERIVELREALADYEKAVQRVLKVAPNHWHQYRDPLEAIYGARRLGSAALSHLQEKGK